MVLVVLGMALEVGDGSAGLGDGSGGPGSGSGSSGDGSCVPGGSPDRVQTGMVQTSLSLISLMLSVAS